MSQENVDLMRRNTVLYKQEVACSSHAPPASPWLLWDPYGAGGGGAISLHARVRLKTLALQ
jgi:hypothetical protein